MAYRFTVNSVIQARLLHQSYLPRPSRLLRPSHLLIKPVYNLRCPNPGQLRSPLTLNSRSYSESTPTPPLLNNSGTIPTSSLPSNSGTIPTASLPNNSGTIKPWRFSKKVDQISSKAMIRMGITLPRLFSVLGAGLLAVIGYLTREHWVPDWFREYRRYVRKNRIYKALHEGPKFGEEIDYIIERKDLVKQVERLITPSASSGSYSLIIGEHGTGKTSLLQLAASSLGKDKGVIYIDVPNSKDGPVSFIEAMKEALNWKSDPLIDPKESSFGEVWKSFYGAAVKYKHKYKKAPVLILDNVNRLAENELALLGQIQDAAKAAADKGIVSVLFVSSEGRVPRRMMKRSSWSRSGMILDIGDVSKEEALEYLKLRDIKAELAAQIYELVGGRIVHLKILANEIQGGAKFQDLRKTMFSNIEEQLESTEILHGQYHEQAGMIIRKLLEEGSVRYIDYVNIVMDSKIRRILLETNVFAFHWGSRQITFQSTLVARFCEQRSAYWTKVEG